MSAADEKSEGSKAPLVSISDAQTWEKEKKFVVS